MEEVQARLELHESRGRPFRRLPHRLQDELGLRGWFGRRRDAPSARSIRPERGFTANRRIRSESNSPIHNPTTELQFKI
jgi:hypothetical protein